jgi:hypothetical protein
MLQNDDTCSVEQNQQETNCPNGRLKIMNVRVVFISSSAYMMCDVSKTKLKVSDWTTQNNEGYFPFLSFLLPAHCWDANANGPSTRSG